MSKSAALGALDRVVRAVAYVRRQHFTTGVLVHITDDSDRVLLVRQRWRQRGRWGFPGGFIRSGESYQDAAVREVWEETSLVIGSPKLVDVYVQPHARHVEVLMMASVDGAHTVAQDSDHPPMWRPPGLRGRSSTHGGATAVGLVPEDWFEIVRAKWYLLTPESMPALTVETHLALERMAGRGV